jgi:hypothetical protein
LGRDLVTLPSLPTRTDYRLRAVSLSDSQYYDFSDEPFMILGKNGVSEASWGQYP